MTIYNTPITVYHKVMEDNSITALIGNIRGHGKHHSKRFKLLEEIYAIHTWDKFACQLIDEFGLSHDVEQIFYKQNTINRCEIEMLLGGSNHETLILILKSEINLIKERIQDSAVKDIRKHHNKLNRTLHSHYIRNPKELTIFEYYSDLSDLKAETEIRQTMEKPHRKVANG